MNGKYWRQILLSTGLLCLLGPISMSIGPVKYTLQTLVIGYISWQFRWRGLIGVVLYVSIGLTGLPFWSNFHSDPNILNSRWGGFVLGFVLMAVLLSFTKRPKTQDFMGIFGFILLGHVVLLSCALIYQILLFAPADPFHVWITGYLPGAILKSAGVSTLVLLHRRLA